MPKDKRTTRGVPYPKKGDNGWWYAHWSDGRRSKRQSLCTKDEVEALKTFAQWVLIEGWTRNGAPGSEVKEYTVADLWGVYDERHVKVHVINQRNVDSSWDNLRPHFGHLTLAQIDQDVVDAYTAKRRSGRIGRPSKEVTVRRELAYLIAALNFCATAAGRKLISKADVPEVKLPSAGQPRDRWLKMDEMKRLLAAAASMRRGQGENKRLSRCERFLWLALETAARQQAILDLTWDRVDFDIGVIHYQVPGVAQTKKRRASVAISANLRPILLQAYKERTGDLVMDNKSPIWPSIQVAAVRAGLAPEGKGRPKATGISPHVLRHTAATHMARRGVPLWAVAKILGNTTQMVESVYAKWVPDNPAGTVDMISGGALEAAE